MHQSTEAPGWMLVEIKKIINTETPPLNDRTVQRTKYRHGMFWVCWCSILITCNTRLHFLPVTCVSFLCSSMWARGLLSCRRSSNLIEEAILMRNWRERWWSPVLKRPANTQEKLKDRIIPAWQVPDECCRILEAKEMRWALEGQGEASCRKGVWTRSWDEQEDRTTQTELGPQQKFWGPKWGTKAAV